ncbi:MAG: hypothetical protein ACRD3S_02570 [Terracidiphilus sp.]
MPEFIANVQYGDWVGQCKADDADFGNGPLRDVLRQRQLIEDGEFVVGFKTWNGENNARGLAPVYLTVVVIPAANYDEAVAYLAQRPIQAREIELELSVDEFAGLFKRFSVAMAWRGMEQILGSEYEND